MADDNVLVVQPPRRVPLLLRPVLWLARRFTGKDPMPARLLAHFPKGAVGAGLFELAAPHGPRDLESRVLAVARVVASAVAGCPFCIDMNAAGWREAGLTVAELESLLRLDRPGWERLGARERLAARYAEALSGTPVRLDEELVAALRAAFSEREIVVLAFTVGQVSFWSRFNQGLGIGSAGFFDEGVCPLPTHRIGPSP
jgi:AhpD family alkylhydroperoxidase